MRRLVAFGSVVALFVMAAVPAAAGAPVETHVDSFTDQSFAGNDGTLNYNGPWVEIGESNGPSSGYVWVWDHEYCDGAFCLKMGGTDDDAEGRGVYRAVDLAGATWAKLIFDYGRELLDEDSEGIGIVQVSPDGGDTWNTVKSISLDKDDDGLKLQTTIVISEWATPDTVIRFKITEAEELAAYWLIDNITVEAKFGETPTTTTTTTEPTTTTTTAAPVTTTTTTAAPVTTTTTTAAPVTTTTITQPTVGRTTTTVPPTTTTTAPPVVADEDVAPEDREMMMNKSGLAITAAMPAIAMPTSTAAGSSPPRPHATPVEALAAAFFTDAGDYGGTLLPSIVLGIVIAVVSLIGIGSRRED